MKPPIIAGAVAFLLALLHPIAVWYTLPAGDAKRWMVWTIREDRTYVDDNLCPTAIAFINSTFLAGLIVLRHCPAFPVTCIAYT